jgi:UDP-galactopyranose mutase
MDNTYDAIVIGAGLAGAVITERLTSRGLSVLVIEKRCTVGGNCYDEIDEETGVRKHVYGPHIFHTNNEQVYEYVKEFSDWVPYTHKVLANVNGHLVPVPFNLTGLNKLFPKTRAFQIEEHLSELFDLDQRITLRQLLNNGGPVGDLAEFIYNKVFHNYTFKQWGLSPLDIGSDVANRVPIVYGYDDRYFTDKYQAVPKYGYTSFIKNLLQSKNVHLLLNADWKDVLRHNENKFYFLNNPEPFYGTVFFTGMIDDLIDNRDLGMLPYRGIRFEHEVVSKEFAQPVATINYPNEGAHTRVTEHKHFPNQINTRLEKTILSREYSYDYNSECMDSTTSPSYPIPSDKSQSLYNKFLEQANKINKLVLVGRLAEYKYYDMDDVIERAINVADDYFEKKGI